MFSPCLCVRVNSLYVLYKDNDPIGFEMSNKVDLVCPHNGDFGRRLVCFNVFFSCPARVLTRQAHDVIL